MQCRSTHDQQQQPCAYDFILVFVWGVGKKGGWGEAGSNKKDNTGSTQQARNPCTHPTQKKMGRTNTTVLQRIPVGVGVCDASKLEIATYGSANEF